jgi:hypothetical protein
VQADPSGPWPLLRHHYGELAAIAADQAERFTRLRAAEVRRELVEREHRAGRRRRRRGPSVVLRLVFDGDVLIEVLAFEPAGGDELCP